MARVAGGPEASADGSFAPRPSVRTDKAHRAILQRFFKPGLITVVGIWILVAIGDAANDESSSTDEASGFMYSPPSYQSTSLTSDLTDSEPVWMRMERERIESAEANIRSLDASLDFQRSDLESMKSRLQLMSDDPYATEVEFENLKARYNRLVDDYNFKVQQRSSSYQDYSASIDNFNSRVDAYHAERH